MGEPSKTMFKHTLTSINSKRDKFGNCYWAFIYINEAGKEISAEISGGEANIKGIVAAAGWDWKEVYYTNREMGIREFGKYVKNLPYAGCTPDELAEYIENELSK